VYVEQSSLSVRLTASGSDDVPVPSTLLREAADEIDALRDALFWCGGSPSFRPGGHAEEGWDKIVAPLMRDEPAPVG
jgi:hypothetical protein